MQYYGNQKLPAEFQVEVHKNQSRTKSVGIERKQLIAHAQAYKSFSSEEDIIGNMTEAT